MIFPDQNLPAACIRPRLPRFAAILGLLRWYTYRSWLDALLRSWDDFQGSPDFQRVGNRSIAVGVHAALPDYGCTAVRLEWIAVWLLRGSPVMVVLEIRHRYFSYFFSRSLLSVPFSLPAE